MSDNPFLSGDQGASTDQPAAPFMPAVPVYDGTTDGLTATVGALVDAVNRLTGNGPPTNNIIKPQPGTTKPSNQKKEKGKPGRFTEVSRTTKSVTVTDPVSGASLTYDDIVGLKFKDNVTGETWEWIQ